MNFIFLLLDPQTGKNRSFFGTGESFLFTVAPERHKFEWVGSKYGAEISLDASLFIAADDTTLIIGETMCHDAICHGQADHVKK
jgi:hypothetical protein